MFVFTENEGQKNNDGGVDSYRRDDKVVEIHDCPDLGDFNPYAMLDEYFQHLPPGGPDSPMWLKPLRNLDPTTGIGYSSVGPPNGVRGHSWLDTVC